MRPKNDEQTRITSITFEALREILSHVTDLPADAVIEGMAVEFDHDTLVLKITSATFEPMKRLQGQPLARIKLRERNPLDEGGGGNDVLRTIEPEDVKCPRCLSANVCFGPAQIAP